MTHHARECRPSLLQMGHGRRAREGFDAANTGGHATFLREDERPDLARGGDVCAAAQFHAVAVNGDHTHLVAVLLAEEGHGTRLDGFRLTLDLGRDRRVSEYLGVDRRLDLAPILGRQGLEVGEVKPQAIGRDERARLADVAAQALAEGGMQEMRRGMVAARRVAGVGIDVRRHLGPHRKWETGASRGERGHRRLSRVSWPSRVAAAVPCTSRRPRSETCPPDST